MSDSNVSVATWEPPAYDMTTQPVLSYTCKPTTDSFTNDFVRLAKWCPDGSMALAQCESGHLRTVNLSTELLHHMMSVAYQPPKQLWLPQPAPILDFAWYPTAAIRDPASFCFVASVRECPVKLLDASDGRLRASYKIVDHRERQVAPHSLAFNPLATKLYCGFEDAIEVFDVHAPGEGTRLHTTPSKKSRDGLKGIVSTIAFSSDISSGVFAAGSLNPSPPTSSNVALFTESTGEAPVMFVGDEKESTFGIRSSCTQVMFNPLRPYLLYAAFRRHDTIYCWDMRGDVNIPVQRFTRSGLPQVVTSLVETNQKMRFDIDLGGRWLAVGDQTGHISVFDLTEPEPEVTEHAFAPRTDQTAALRFHAHNDTIGSVGFHPLRALLLSVSGSRHFDPTDTVGSDYVDGSSESDSDIEDGLLDLEKRLPVRKRYAKVQPVTQDNSVKVWDFGGTTLQPAGVF